MERMPTDARRPFEFDQLGRFLARRQAAGVWLKRRDNQSMGYYYGELTMDVRRPFGFGHFGRVLARRYTAGVRLRR